MTTRQARAFSPVVALVVVAASGFMTPRSMNWSGAIDGIAAFVRT